MSAPGWLSEWVEKVSDFFVGTLVVRLMSGGHETISSLDTVNQLSVQSLDYSRESEVYPVESGATSSKQIYWVFFEVFPESIATWTAAPIAYWHIR